MPDIQDKTESLCPHCLSRVSARRVTERGCVYLLKACPVHGYLDKVLLWRNTPYSYRQWQRQKSENTTPFRDSASNCPFNCGICSDHRQETCTAVIEVSRRCNMHCPVCFAESGTVSSSDPGRKQLALMLQSVLDRGGPCPVQFSGGEPTLRDDLPDIAAMALSMGFDHIQVNTNGIRLANDTDYGRALKKSGVSTIFLQFDGVTDSVHTRIRGKALCRIKGKVIDRCSELKLGVILVPTLVKGVNDSQIGAIIRFAKKHIPVVKGVHFQPMTFLGRFPGTPANARRLLIPDILKAIEKQTCGELKTEHFIPPGCEESHCSFSAFTVLGSNGTLIPTTRFDLARKGGDCCSGNHARQSRDYVRNRWKYHDTLLPTVASNPNDGKDGTLQEGFLERALSHSLCISGMAFQDVWNIDLERLQRCCVHVVTPEKKMVPFCIRYLTDSQGKRLYPYYSESR